MSTVRLPAAKLCPHAVASRPKMNAAINKSVEEVVLKTGSRRRPVVLFAVRAANYIGQTRNKSRGGPSAWRIYTCRLLSMPNCHNYYIVSERKRGTVVVNTRSVKLVLLRSVLTRLLGMFYFSTDLHYLWLITEPMRGTSDYIKLFIFTMHYVFSGFRMHSPQHFRKVVISNDQNNVTSK